MRNKSTSRTHQRQVQGNSLEVCVVQGGESLCEKSQGEKCVRIDSLNDLAKLGKRQGTFQFNEM